MKLLVYSCIIRPQISQKKVHPLWSRWASGQASFSWLDTTDSRSDDTFLPSWDIQPGQQKQYTLFLHAPLTPTDYSLNIVANYSLASDKATQICKTLLLDIPIIQPFHINFDIRPCLSTDGMPDFFNEGESLLRVSQSWLLRSSLNRLGSDKLEVQRMQITGDFQKEEMALRIYDDNKTCPLTSDAFGISQQAVSHCSSRYCALYHWDDTCSYTTWTYWYHAYQSQAYNIMAPTILISSLWMECCLYPNTWINLPPICSSYPGRLYNSQSI